MVGSKSKKVMNIKFYWKRCLGAALMFFVFTASYAFGAEVLFIVGSPNLKAGDRAIKSHLENRGFNVHIQEDDVAKSEDAIGRDLVMFSESARSKAVGDKFRNIPVPIICSEPWIFHGLGMTGQTKRVDFGRKGRQKDIIIVNSSHPLSSSLSDVVRVSTKSFYMGWGVPGENAIPIAVLKNDPAKCTIFAYDAGVQMPGLVAPAKRVGLFLFRGTAGTFTDDGWRLFNAVVDWSIDKPKTLLRADN